MLIPGIVLSVVGVGFFCWLLFRLAVYALPFYAGLTAALAAFHVGSGVIGALVIGVLAGGATLAIGQIAFATAPRPLIRAAIALLYAAPAAIAGYHAALGLALIAVPSEGWRDAFAVVGAILVGATALARMSLFVPPTVGQRVAGPARSLPLAQGSARGELTPSSSLGWKSGP
jgi:hypothetical protein